MAFRSANLQRFTRFNSSVSCDLIDKYDTFLDLQAQAESDKPSARAFAPSSIRCERKSWFRLRGTEPDTLPKYDTTLNFKAKLGTACHRIVQSDFQSMLADDWISVKDYLDLYPISLDYTLTAASDSLETFVSISNPPVRFACDGIVKLNNQYYLLEIKTCDYDVYMDLTDPKSVHIDQVKAYCTLLGLTNVLFVYVDRQYGGIKCFEYIVSDVDKRNIMTMFQNVQDMAIAGIAPNRLDWADYECTNCKYKLKCKQWG